MKTQILKLRGAIQTTKIEKSEFEQIENEDKAFLAFRYFLYSLAYYNQKPFEVAILNNKNSAVTFIFYKRNKSGKISTRQFSIPREDSPFFNSWISQNFPRIKRRVYNSVGGDSAENYRWTDNACAPKQSNTKTSRRFVRRDGADTLQTH